MRELEEEINEAFSSCYTCEISIFPFEESVVELLKDRMEDLNDDIDFWIYDLEMGTTYSEYKIEHEEIYSTDFADIRSAEELYDYLVTL